MYDWYTASAPGKSVILGEHAVVYGKPAIVMSINRRITCSIRRSYYNMLNGECIDFKKQPHFKYITRDTHYNLECVTSSKIPTGSGLGSSAALSAALAMAIRTERREQYDERALVDEAYGAEIFTQGNGSPMDASACVHGGGITVNIPGTENHNLWTISRENKTWRVADIDIPNMTFVIGHTGIRAPTGPIVSKVHRFMEKNHFAIDIINEIGCITEQGYNAIRKGDIEELGRLMTDNHKLLSILGVSCKELNKLVRASLPYSYGAKLTGSGGGGCMIVLTDKPKEVCEAI